MGFFSARKKIMKLEYEVAKLTAKLDNCTILLKEMSDNFDIPYCVRKRIRNLIKEIEG